MPANLLCGHKARCAAQAREHLLLLKHLWETPLFFTRFIGNQ